MGRRGEKKNDQSTNTKPNTRPSTQMDQNIGTKVEEDRRRYLAAWSSNPAATANIMRSFTILNKPAVISLRSAVLVAQTADEWFGGRASLTARQGHILLVSLLATVKANAAKHPLDCIVLLFGLWHCDINFYYKFPTAVIHSIISRFPTPGFRLLAISMLDDQELSLARLPFRELLEGLTEDEFDAIKGRFGSNLMMVMDESFLESDSTMDEKRAFFSVCPWIVGHAFNILDSAGHSFDVTDADDCAVFDIFAHGYPLLPPEFQTMAEGHVVAVFEKLRDAHRAKGRSYNIPDDLVDLVFSFFSNKKGFDEFLQTTAADKVVLGDISSIQALIKSFLL